jgi:hypothetical protein
MVSFVRKRLQVFVSSTFTDLIQERQAAVEAILTHGHIPAGMELFTAGDESQMKVIKQWIDESDVYLMILAGRYGSIEPNTGKSYTQLEYEYAAEQDKPLFACVITEEALEERLKLHGSSHIETDNQKELKEFRALVLSKMSSFWADQKDIKIEVGKTLSDFARREDLKGWVRAGDEVNAPALADEIARLSKENAELRRQIGVGPDNEKFFGWTFEEFKEVLEQHGAIELLVQNTNDLLSGHGYSPLNREKEAAELLKITGLLESDSLVLGLRLTDIGKSFMHRLMFHELKKKSANVMEIVNRDLRNS